ncbi:MAG: NAD(P)-dependent dehydrogenase (short-subunit alcohol dehydrogenase family), partial [Mariniflexile sp.]
MSKVVLITGGSSGIGKSIGEYLTEKGFMVYGTSRKPENYKESKFPILELDVKNSQTIQQTVKAIIEIEGKLDVVINNAGAGITGAIEEIPETEIRANFDTNFFGPINVIKAVLPQMRKQ